MFNPDCFINIHTLHLCAHTHAKTLPSPNSAALCTSSTGSEAVKFKMASDVAYFSIYFHPLKMSSKPLNQKKSDHVIQMVGSLFPPRNAYSFDSKKLYCKTVYFGICFISVQCSQSHINNFHSPTQHILMSVQASFLLKTVNIALI